MSWAPQEALKALYAVIGWVGLNQAESSPFAEVRLLGPVELGFLDGSSAAVKSPLQRTLLAMLAVNAGMLVSTDSLIAGLWDAVPPPSARHALHVHVSSLRHRLAVDPSPLQARPSGYVLALHPGQLDTERFESLAATGRAELASNHPERAVEQLQAALEIWRGPVLADVPADRIASAEAARLEEARRATESSMRSCNPQLQRSGGRPRPRHSSPRRHPASAAGRNDPAPGIAAAARPTLCAAFSRSARCYGRSWASTPAACCPTSTAGCSVMIPASPSAAKHCPTTPQVLTCRSPASRVTAGLPWPTRYSEPGRSTWCSSPASPRTWRSAWEDPALSHLYRRLAASCRLILLDKETGMSDRAGGSPLAEHVDDVLAVIDAVGSTRAALFGVLDGGAIALLTAVTHPDRVAGVVTYATPAVLSAATIHRGWHPSSSPPYRPC